MLRWLLPIVTVLAVLGQAVAAYAAAGVIGEASCCCPSPAKCKCHDHDGKSSSEQLQRCSGEAKLVAPAPTIAVVPTADAPAAEPRVTALPPRDPAPPLAELPRAPEPPPF